MKPYLMLSCLILAGCGSDNERKETETLTIESYQVLGSDFLGNQVLCPAVKSAVTLQPTAYCEAIIGFDYRWGFTTTMKIYKETISNPPQDASNIRTVLDTIISQTEDALGTNYQLNAFALDGLAFYQEDNRYYLSGSPINCSATANCDLLASMKDSGVTVDLTLTYQGQGLIELSSWQ